MRRALLLLGLLTVGLAAPARAAQATTPSGFTIARSANLGGVNAQFLAVAAPSRTSAFVVGNLRTLSDPWALLEQWNGKTWSRIGLPSLPPTAVESLLKDVSAASPNDVWAVGWSATPKPKYGGTIRHQLVYRRTAAGWHRVTITVPGNHDFSQVNSVSVRSPTNVWALADDKHNCTQDVLHYDGVRWSVVEEEHCVDSLYHWTRITARDSGSVWTVGAGCDPASIPRENWRCGEAATGCAGGCGMTPGYGPSNTAIDYTDGAGTPSDFWAIGRDLFNGTPHAAHWDGSTWQDDSPSLGWADRGGPHEIDRGVLLPDGDLWTVGFRRARNGTTSIARTLMIEHTAGGWSQVGSTNSGHVSNALASIAHVGGTETGMWAVGMAGSQPLLLHHP